MRVCVLRGGVGWGEVGPLKAWPGLAAAQRAALGDFGVFCRSPARAPLCGGARLPPTNQPEADDRWCWRRSVIIIITARRWAAPGRPDLLSWSARPPRGGIRAFIRQAGCGGPSMAVGMMPACCGGCGVDQSVFRCRWQASRSLPAFQTVGLRRPDQPQAGVPPDQGRGVRTAWILVVGLKSIRGQGSQDRV